MSIVWKAITPNLNLSIALNQATLEKHF